MVAASASERSFSSLPKKTRAACRRRARRWRRAGRGKSRCSRARRCPPSTYGSRDAWRPSASRNLRRSVRSGVRYVFLTSCCVMVEPPCFSSRESSPQLKAARAMPQRSTRAVLEEATVFDGEDGAAQHLGNLCVRERGALGRLLARVDGQRLGRERVRVERAPSPRDVRRCAAAVELDAHGRDALAAAVGRLRREDFDRVRPDAEAAVPDAARGLALDVARAAQDVGETFGRQALPRAQRARRGVEPGAARQVARGQTLVNDFRVVCSRGMRRRPRWRRPRRSGARPRRSRRATRRAARDRRAAPSSAR